MSFEGFSLTVTIRYRKMDTFLKEKLQIFRESSWNTVGYLKS